MANRIFSDTQSLNKEVKFLAGRFDDADTSKAGLGFTAANTGTGIYVVTFNDAYNALLSATANVQSTTGTDDYVVSIAAHDVATAKTITFHVAVAGTLTDLGTGDEIHFFAAMQNSSAPSV